jgi:serine phosphatase RsbU (regulator of sigma subunit)
MKQEEKSVNYWERFFMYIRQALILFLLLPLQGYSQAKKNIDSLEAGLQSPKADSLKVLDMCELCAAYTFTDQEKSLKYSEQGIALAEKIKFGKGKAICSHRASVVYYYQGKYDRALECCLRSLSFFEEALQKTPGSAEAKRWVADNLHSMGKIYNRQRQFDNSLSSFERALAIYEATGDNSGISNCYNNMAVVYDQLQDHEKARHYLVEFLRMAEQLGDKSRMATALNNIGLVYKAEKKYSEALLNINRGLKIREEINEQKGLAYSYNDLGDLYMELGNMSMATSLFHKSLEHALRSNSKERVKAAYEALSLAYAKSRNFEKAYKYQSLLASLKDSLFNDETVKRMAEMTARYEGDKKQHQIELLQKNSQLQESEIAKRDAEAKKQHIQKIAFASGFVFLFILAGVVFYSFRQKQKDNRNLALQKSIIEVKHKEITDSILYARRIQQAMLTSQEYISRYAPQHFIFFKPRDIVSGDFYWALHENGKFWMAACDCTGHGVPGAFMSLLNISYLNEAVLEKKIGSPEKVLNEVRASLTRSLDPDGRHETRDGMDCAVFAIDLRNRTLEASCANNSLFVWRKGECIQLKADKQPVGFQHDEIKPFTLHRLQLEPGDMIYAFTDGFADQFGGSDGKKFKSTNFRKLLDSVSDRPVQEQLKTIAETFEKWKGSLEQVDDVCVIGVRIPS